MGKGDQIKNANEELGFKQLDISFMLPLKPYYLRNLEDGVNAEMASHLLKYVPEFEGKMLLEMEVLYFPFFEGEAVELRSQPRLLPRARVLRPPFSTSYFQTCRQFFTAGYISFVLIKYYYYGFPISPRWSHCVRRAKGTVDARPSASLFRSSADLKQLFFRSSSFLVGYPLP